MYMKKLIRVMARDFETDKKSDAEQSAFIKFSGQELTLKESLPNDKSQELDRLLASIRDYEKFVIERAIEYGFTMVCKVVHSIQEGKIDEEGESIYESIMQSKGHLFFD